MNFDSVCVNSLLTTVLLSNTHFFFLILLGETKAQRNDL